METLRWGDDKFGLEQMREGDISLGPEGWVTFQQMNMKGNIRLLGWWKTRQGVMDILPGIGSLMQQ